MSGLEIFSIKNFLSGEILDENLLFQRGRKIYFLEIYETSWKIEVWKIASSTSE
jgi:hypothetical protein